MASRTQTCAKGHDPLAQVDADFPVIVAAPNEALQEANLQLVRLLGDQVTVLKGAPVDRPKNPAKSVTVE